MQLMKNKEGYHLPSAVNSEYTLCGDAWEGACTGEGGRDHLEMTYVEGNKVTCRRCLKVIRSVREYLELRKHVSKKHKAR